ncbi:MAG: universal stress protein [Sandaracinaceae bacterium]|nr:universal stress protein [Sandaracinaceae bacterium]
MPDIRRILCPVDFSEPSDRAFEYALDFATKFGAEVHLVHVYQLPVYALPDGAMMAGPELTVKITDELSQALKAQAGKAPAGSKVQTHLVEGIPYREVTRLAEELGCDLIVMGTHGRTGIKHLLLGSVAERVVRTAKVPVITIPTPGKG